SDTEDELGAHHALDLDAINDLLDVRQDLARKLDLAEPECPPPPRRAQPTEEEAQHLPKRVKPEAARHDRIAFEVTGEEPEVRLEAEPGAPHPLAILSPRLRDLGDSVEHQHGRQG